MVYLCFVARPEDIRWVANVVQTDEHLVRERWTKNQVNRVKTTFPLVIHSEDRRSDESCIDGFGFCTLFLLTHQGEITAASRRVVAQEHFKDYCPAWLLEVCHRISKLGPGLGLVLAPSPTHVHVHVLSNTKQRYMRPHFSLDALEFVSLGILARSRTHRLCHDKFDTFNIIRLNLPRPRAGPRGPPPFELFRPEEYWFVFPLVLLV